MGTETTNTAPGGFAGLAQKRCARWCGFALHLALSCGLWIPIGLAQPAGETAQQPAAQMPPATDEAAKALAERLEALEKLATGVLPAIPLDSLLGVSLDDDSSMIERDAEARFERRRLTIALNQAERLQNKSAAELQQLRDQITALELERKVLSLPIEVRERLVEENYRQPSAPVQQAQPPVPVVPDKPVVATQPVANADEPPPAKSAARPTAEVPDRPWLSGWLLFAALLVATFILARVVGAAIRAVQSGGSEDERRAQIATFAQLGICIAGFVAALMLSFRLPPEIFTLVLGTLALIAVLAGKDVAASLLGGLILLLEPPFRIGHRVEIGGVEGRVTEMGLLSVRVLGPQQRSIRIPNSEFLTKHVSAAAPSGILTPLQVDFYIHPQDDIAHAKGIINEVIQRTRGADASKARGGILVTQIPLNGVVMVRLRAKVFVTGTHPEQEIASELSERVLARLRGGDAAPMHESEPPEDDAMPSVGQPGSEFSASR